MIKLFSRFGLILKWLRIKWSLWRFAVPAVCNGFISLICYAIGSHLSTNASAMPIARAGAAATAIAIAFTFYDYRKALRASGQAAYKAFEKFTEGLPLTGSASLKLIDRKLRRNTSRADCVITSIQAIILIIATLVWGFGDLAPPWLIGL